MTAVVWPKLVVIPPAARSQWHRLVDALASDEAPCVDEPRMWFSRHPAETRAACRLCHDCHAFAECGAYADAAHEDLGVWAGRDRTVRQRTTKETDR